MHQLQRQAEKQLALRRAQEEKDEKDRLRQLAQEALCKKARAERQLQEALVEVRLLVEITHSKMTGLECPESFRMMS